MQNLDVHQQQYIQEEINDDEDQNYDMIDQANDWDNKIDLYEIANAAGTMFGGGGIVKTAALDEFFNKLKNLEHAWCDSEKKYNELKAENDKLTHQ